MKQPTLRIIKLQTINGDIILHRNCLEFMCGRKFLYFVLLNNNKTTVEHIPVKDIISFELKNFQGTFTRVNIHKLGNNIKRKRKKQNGDKITTRCNS